MIAVLIPALLARSAEAFAPFSTPRAPAPHLHTRLQDVAAAGVEEGTAAVEKEGSPDKKKYVIVGGGWGGWGAAKALCER